MVTVRIREKVVRLGLLISALVVVASGQQAEAAVPNGQMIGYIAYSKKINSRIWNQKKIQFSVKSSVGELQYLMGGYDGFGIHNSYRLGEPSSQGYLIYHLAAIKLALLVSQTCNTELKMAADSDFNPEFFRLVHTICKSESSLLKEKLYLKKYWRTFMGTIPPEEEFVRWRDHILARSTENQDGTKTVFDMTFTILLNSHFLMKR